MNGGNAALVNLRFKVGHFQRALGVASVCLETFSTPTTLVSHGLVRSLGTTGSVLRCQHGVDLHVYNAGRSWLSLVPGDRRVHAAVPAGSRSAVLHPPDGSDVVTRRLDSLDSFPEDDFRQSLNRQQGEGYDADAVPQSAEQEAPLGTSGLDPTGTQLPEGARFPHFSPDVTAPVFSVRSVS